MNEIVFSEFEERSYDLDNIGIDGFLVIEEDKIYIETEFNRFIINDLDEFPSILFDDNREILELDEDQKKIIIDILVENNTNYQNKNI